MTPKPQEISVVIPSEVENLSLPNPNLVTYYRNLENRVLWLDSDVDDCWLEFSRKIIEWNRDDKGIPVEERKPIKLMIFSYGGELDINNSIIDIIKQSKTPVWGFNMGQAQSAGCFIFISCHRRFVMPNASFLIHQGSGENISGNYNQICAFLMEYQRKIKELEKYLLENTKIPKKIMEKNIGDEWYIDAKTALEYGVCDEIISDIDAVL